MLAASSVSTTAGVAQPLGVPYVIELFDGVDASSAEVAACLAAAAVPPASAAAIASRRMNITAANGVKYACCLPALDAVASASKQRHRARWRAARERAAVRQKSCYDKLPGFAYLGGCAAACKGYTSLSRAQAQCNALGATCGGVTLSNGKYELRTASSTGASPSKEQSWKKRPCTEADLVASTAAAAAGAALRDGSIKEDGSVDVSEVYQRIAALRTAPAVGVAPAGCFWHRAGYWTYELCPFVSASQFHLEGNSLEKGASFSLGAWQQSTSGASVLGVSPAALMLAAPQFTQRYAPSGSGGSGSGGSATTAAPAAGRQAIVTYTCDASPTSGGSAAAAGAGGVATADGALHTVAEGPTHAYNFGFKTRYACANASTYAGKIGGILAPLYKQCIHKQDGWWTFEICHGKRVRQYHKEKDSVTECVALPFRFGSVERAKVAAVYVAPPTTST